MGFPLPSLLLILRSGPARGLRCAFLEAGSNEEGKQHGS